MNTDRDLLQQALEALEFHVKNADEIEEIDLVLVTALRERLAHCDRCGKKLGGPDHIHTCSPQQPVFHLRSHGDVSAEELERLAQPVQEPVVDERIKSVRHMRDIQGYDGNWNYDPYMQGLYNGLEFALSLLEVREPQFKDAPETWLGDIKVKRDKLSSGAAHGIGEKPDAA